MRPLLFLDKISDFRFVITPFVDDGGDYLKCDMYNKYTDEYVDTIRAGTFSEMQDIIAVKYNS